MADDTDLPTPSEIIDIHDEIEDDYGLKYTGMSARLPERTLDNILSDVAEQTDLYRRAAALCRRLISAHIFEDGNKRTAWTVTRLYLEQHGAEPAVHDPNRLHRSSGTSSATTPKHSRSGSRLATSMTTH
ncbi:MAG: type II toxin-antitoxin system death-on-curing family toxin [Halococcoides sp.]